MKSTILVLAIIASFSFSANALTVKEIFEKNKHQSLGYINDASLDECYFNHVKHDDYVEYGAGYGIYGMYVNPNEYQGEWSIDENKNTITYCSYDAIFEQITCNYRTEFIFKSDLKIISYTIIQDDKEYLTCYLKPQ